MCISLSYPPFIKEGDPDVSGWRILNPSVWSLSRKAGDFSQNPQSRYTRQLLCKGAQTGRQNYCREYILILDFFAIDNFTI